MGLYQDAREDGSGNIYVNLQDGVANALTSHAVSGGVPVPATGGVQALDVFMNGGFLDTGVPDETGFVYGTSYFQPVGGAYEDTSPTLTAGQSGVARLTQNRGLHVNLRNSSGGQLGDLNSEGLWIRPGDGTNVGTYSATSEAFTQLRQGGNVANVNASNELLVKDTTADTHLISMDAKLSPTTGTLSQLVVSASSQVALALNTSRKGFIMVNDSNKTIWVAFAATASASAYTYKILPNSTIEPNFGSYTGVISAISLSGVAGNLVITELT